MLKPGDKVEFTQSAVILERLIGQLITGLTNSGGNEGKSGATTAAATQGATTPR
jgi:hypothetical protein